MFKFFNYIIFSIIFISCSTSQDVKSNNIIAYLIDAKVNGIDYYCDNKLIGTTGDYENTAGSFKVNKKQCNIIVFKLSQNIILGDIDINDINNDKNVFISEILGFDRFDSNNSKTTNVLRILQTLDEDENLQNGINITKNIKSQIQEQRENINEIIDFKYSSYELNSNDLKNILKNTSYSNRDIITKHKSLIHYEQTLRDMNNQTFNNTYKINAVDTVPPLIAIINNNIISTASNTKESITIQGEKYLKLYINGINKQVSLDKNGILLDFHIDTSHNNNTFKDFNITLEDLANRMSKSLNLRVYKDTIDPVFHYNTPYNETIIYNIANGKKVFDINISDLSIQNNLTLDFEISGTDANLFEINATTNSLLFKDIPSQSNTYNINIKAKDKAGGKAIPYSGVNFTIIF